MAFSLSVNGFNVTLRGGFGSAGGMRYPDDIDANLPTITFIARAPKGTPHGSVTMYMPPAISINDGAGYSELQLGLFGNEGNMANFEASMDAILSAEKADSESIGGLMKGLTGANSGSSSTSKMLGLEAMSKAGLGGGVTDRAKDLYMYRKGKVLNPNTVLKYDGPAIRDFSFQFTMTPKSSQESDIINNIHRFFRTYMHPEGTDDGLLLGYPDIWYIRFNAGSTKNTYVPNINDCYLTGCSMAINPSNNSFHEGGAPNEVSLTLSFRETRQNKRHEV